MARTTAAAPSVVPNIPIAARLSLALIYTEGLPSGDRDVGHFFFIIFRGIQHATRDFSCIISQHGGLASQ